MQLTRNRKKRPPRRYRKRSRFWDVLLTIMFFGALGWSIVWLDGQNAEEMSGPFRAVDGDTLIYQSDKLRLAGIDAPELNQNCLKSNDQLWTCGRSSRAALRKLSQSGNMICKGSSRDKYDRLLVRCYDKDEEINAQMVRLGWALDYGGYAREEADARRAKRGIWQGAFENPQEWRRAHQEDVAVTGLENSLSRLQDWFSKLVSDSSGE